MKNNEEYAILINGLNSSDIGVWECFTKLSLISFNRCNNPLNTHSPEIILVVFKTIIIYNSLPLKKSFRQACKDCCSIELKTVKNEVKAYFNKNHWDKIGSKSKEPIKRLKERGLQFYKPVPNPVMYLSI